MGRTRCRYFSEEIILKILLLLPVISLLRCRSVCKLWVSIISNTQFIQTHLTNSQKRPYVVARVVSDELEDVEDVYIDTRKHSVRLNLSPRLSADINRFIGTCNGLVCLSNLDGDVIYLWNPSTNQLKLLPSLKIQAHCFRTNLGFGFDSISNDYKLLRFVSSDDGFVTYVAEMYSANADSWKQINVPETIQSFLSYPANCVHAKTGALYVEGKNELVSFDLHDELFGVYSLPNSMKHKRMSSVFDFEGSVAMVFQSGSILSVWTLDDVCGKGFWTEKFNLEADVKIVWVFFYLGFGQFVASDSSGYILYDYKKKETKKFLPSTAPAKGLISVFKYTESLVSLKGFQQQE